MSSRREHSTHSTGSTAGTHRANHRAQSSSRSRPDPSASPQRPPDRYEPYLDGLFTYCLSVLCEHDAATAVLGEVLAIAERQRGRRPADDAQRRPWLYAIARWACLQQLAEKRRSREAQPPAQQEAPALSEAVTADRRRELAALAWPEAAGTTPEQREALELAVRHQLRPEEVAAVLGMERDAARALLSSAACEVERTRAALVVVERGSCPVVARLTGDNQVLLSTALRRELVRHVDDCPECRRAAERATAGGPWPGSTAVPGTLPVLQAPPAAAHAAMTRALTRPGGARTGPRYDRSGFPMDPKDRAAMRRRMRSRAVTTTVVATVIAAPVLALWAAYRGAPLTGEGPDVGSVSAVEEDASDGLGGRPYEKAGNAEVGPHPGFSAGKRSPDVSVEVVDADGAGRPRHGGDSRRTPSDRAMDRGGPSGAAGPSGPGRPGAGQGPGRLTVDAQPGGDATLITLSASGGSPVRWSAYADQPWLRLSMTSGVLRPGESVTITVSVDSAQEPRGRWTARVAIDPSGSVITIQGRGTPPEPTPTPTPTPSPSDPEPSPTPSDGTTSPSGSGSPSQSG
ncbi:sigma-70 family RNA polymerase sigma factor [Streptomyces sp. NPDC004647]|uniref:BACON domain-containing protein n=1 Tax=Streptomyces sp. NPDC004647 TaxID=3154671 RepID=UPI0033ACE3D6